MEPTDEKGEGYYQGVTFINFQSGSSGQPSERVIQLLTQVTIDLHKARIRTYTNIQVGVPHNCGGPGQPSCH